VSASRRSALVQTLDLQAHAAVTTRHRPTAHQACHQGALLRALRLVGQNCTVRTEHPGMRVLPPLLADVTNEKTHSFRTHPSPSSSLNHRSLTRCAD
jgi:hypothetical protein